MLHAFEGHTGLMTSMALSVDGRVPATGSNDETARMRSAETGKMLQALEGDGRVLATGSNDRSAETGNMLQALERDTGRPLRS